MDSKFNQCNVCDVSLDGVPSDDNNKGIFAFLNRYMIEIVNFCFLDADT